MNTQQRSTATESMTRSRIGFAPWLIVLGVALAVIVGPAVSPAAAAISPAATIPAPTSPAAVGLAALPASTIDTNLAGPPADPSMVFTGTAHQPLAGSLPGSSAPIPASFAVTDPNMLPPGVFINPAGTVTGIPTADGIYAVGITACDTLACTPGSVTFAIAPDQAPSDQQSDKQPGSSKSAWPGIGSATVALALQTIRLGP